MEILKIILLAVALIGIAMLGMAISILVKRGGKFPNTHISGNRHLRQNGIYCATTQDKIAQRSTLKVKYDKLKLTPDIKTAK